MSVRTTISTVAAALAALLLVALTPGGAAAHGGHPHAVPAKHASGALAADKGASRAEALAEVRSQSPIPADQQTGSDCGDRGCCSNGHCSGCGTAIAPAEWTCSRLPAAVVIRNPDASLPSGLAREGPPRPPKSFV